jgi:hypothetical protein
VVRKTKPTQRFPGAVSKKEIEKREATTKQRYQDISASCETFIESMRDEYKKVSGIQSIQCDFAILYDVVRSAYDDIWRYKDYHLTNPNKQRSNSIKRAAYLTKWLVRLRPILIVRDTDHFSPKDGTILLNEAFAIFISLIYIADELCVDALRLTPEVANDFLYDLHYREISDDALLSFYQLISRVASQKLLVEVSF